MLLDELVRGAMLTERQPGRYAFHDLLRAYALELVQDLEARQEYDSALACEYDHYRQAAHNAHLFLEPKHLPIEPSAPQPGTSVETFADWDAAMRWFADERRVLGKVVARTAAGELPGHAWQLTLMPFYERVGLYEDWAAAARAM